MTAIDTFIVIMWIAVTMFIGMWSGYRSDLESFWVNRRSTHTLFLVATIVSTQVGGGVLVGITSSSFTSGTGFGLVALVSTVSGFLTIAWLAPWAKRFGDKYKAYTLPEVIGKRYGRPAQVASAVLILCTYLSLLAGQLLPVAFLVQQWTGWGAEITLALAAGGVVVYSAFAGLKGDIITDSLHFCAMTLVLLILIPCTLYFHYPVTKMLSHISPELWSPVVFGGYTYLIVGIALGALIPIVSMEMWMRVYAASDERVARQAFVWSSLVVIPFYALPVLLGLLAKQMNATDTEVPDKVFINITLSIFPSGLRGVAVAAFLAVLISTANTLIVVLGAIVYRDLMCGCKQGGFAEMRTSRMVTLVVGLLGLGIAFAVPDVVQSILNAFFILGMIAPILLGLRIWKRATGKGAVASLVVGGMTTLGFLPVIPRHAFLPGLILGSLTFVIVSLLTAHGSTEDLSL